MVADTSLTEQLAQAWEWIFLFLSQTAKQHYKEYWRIWELSWACLLRQEHLLQSPHMDKVGRQREKYRVFPFLLS